MQVVEFELVYFAMVCLVFLFAYGVAVQSLLYPNSEDKWWDILYRIFYQPYLTMFQQFHIDELQGMPFHVRQLYFVCRRYYSIVMYSYSGLQRIVDICANYGVHWDIGL